MSKDASPDHPVHELISTRWSPYSFSRRLIPREDLLSIFEAARWAASSFNEQPWRYLVASRDRREDFDRILSCLLEGQPGLGARSADCRAGMHPDNVLPQRQAQPRCSARSGTGLCEPHVRGDEPGRPCAPDGRNPARQGTGGLFHPGWVRGYDGARAGLSG